jgi:purine-binding chemotaxis protein CheW
MNDNAKLAEYVTFTSAGQLFGLPIERVQDVFKISHITRVPLAGAEIAGVLNLRGRIVTAINLGNRLELETRADARPPMAIGIESGTESFGFLVDAVGEVLKLADGERETIPINLDRKLARVASGVFRLDGQLLVVLDVDRVLDFGAEAAAA